MIPTLEEIRQAYVATRAATQETPLPEVRARAAATGAVDAKGRRVLVYLTGSNVSLPAFVAHVEGLNGS